MSKKLMTFLFTLVLFFFAVMPSNAQDIEISCGNDGILTVSPDPVGNLFDEDYLAPGETVQKTIEITNNDVNDSCDVTFDISSVDVDENDISEKYFTNIQVNGIDVFGDRTGSEANSSSTLSDLFDAGIIDFASISTGNTITIDWIVTFDSSSGNEYQGRSLSFDFLLNFKWGSVTDGVEGTGEVEGASDTRGIGDVLGVTGEAILIPISIAIVVFLFSIYLYNKLKKGDN